MSTLMHESGNGAAQRQESTEGQAGRAAEARAATGCGCEAGADWEYFMKQLPSTFTKSGFDHQLLLRIGDVAIYRRNRVKSAVVHFEVVRIGRHNGYELAGNHIPAAETYPGAEQWGSKGWTYSDESHAENGESAGIVIANPDAHITA